jgi:hypothetical protein
VLNCMECHEAISFGPSSLGRTTQIRICYTFLISHHCETHVHWWSKHLARA